MPVVASNAMHGVEWIFVRPCGPSEGAGAARHRLVHNAKTVHLQQPLGLPEPYVLKAININDAFTLQLPAPGLVIPLAGLRFPPGSLQIVVDEHDQQVRTASTQLPIPQKVPTTPCSGWCQKRHLYVNFGMDELAVVFFNRWGWPIACRENYFNRRGQRVGVDWWRFDYSRPEPD